MAWPLKPYLQVAVLTSAHGIKGELKAKLLSDRADRLAGLKEAFLFSPDGQTNLGKVRILAVRGAESDLIQLEGVSDRTSAEKLKGHYLSVDRSASYELAEDEYFIADLIGMRVSDDSHGAFGTLIEVPDSPSGKMFQIKRPGRKELYLPIREGVIQSVDFENGIIQVSLPDGLWGIYD